MVGQKISRVRSLIILLAIILAVIYIFPFFWTLITSFKTPPEASFWPPTIIPRNITLEAFVEVWKTFPYPRWFFNSILVALITALGVLGITGMAAYAFAFYRFRGDRLLFILLLSSLMIPIHIRMIPSFMLIRSLSLAESYPGIFLPQISSMIALGIFLLRQNNRYIPKDLIDAARIDGCGELRIFLTIILPLTKSAMIALGIFVLVYSWNDFLWPLIVVQRDSMKTLPVGLLDLSPTAITHKMTWPQRMAGTVIVVLPIMLLFPLFRNLFIKSFAMTGLKD